MDMLKKITSLSTECVFNNQTLKLVLNLKKNVKFSPDSIIQSPKKNFTLNNRKKQNSVERVVPSKFIKENSISTQKNRVI